MVLARILTDPSMREMIMRQSPGYSGRWDDIQFTLDDIKLADYLIVLDFVARDTVVDCNRQNIWCVIHEPPVEMFDWFRNGFDQFGKVFIPDAAVQGTKYVRAPTAIPWHIDRSYDFLKNCLVPAKDRQLSWVISNKDFMDGHKMRLAFMNHLRNRIAFDLWGKGFNYIEDKWNGISPYRYSMAIENFSGPFYWTEKITDCFLSYSMPIYFGCTQIQDYFPEESYVQIDINNPNEAIEIIEDAVGSDLWKRNFDAVVHARELILEKYQFFPFFAGHITADKAKNDDRSRERIFLPKHTQNPIHRMSPRRVLSKLRKTLYRAN